MALRPCPECGKEVSDKAPTCPHCGAPQGEAASASSASTATSRRSPSQDRRRLTLILLVVVIAVAAFVAWRLAAPVLQTAGIVPAPRWSVDNAGGDDACTVLGDYCMRVRCAVVNIGNAAGAAYVVATVYPDQGGQLTKRGTVSLQPGQRDTVVLDFPEAEMGREYRYSCSYLPL